MNFIQALSHTLIRRWCKYARARHYRKLIILSLFISLCVGPTHALDPDKLITQYGQDTWQAEQGLPQNSVAAIAQTRNGYLWFGTEEGLARFDGVRFEVFDKNSNPPLRENNVSALFEDSRSALWIGTSGGGLARYYEGRFAAYTTRDGLLSNVVRVIYEDRRGGMWIGTNGGGLNYLKDGKLTAYTTADGLSSDMIRAIYEDEAGTLWVGTKGGGLNRFKDERFTSFGTRDGLFDDVIYQILPDDTSNLWMSCNKGIFKLSLRELDDYAAGKITRLSSTSYSTLDGLPSNECNGSAYRPGPKPPTGGSGCRRSKVSPALICATLN